jgi:TPR repeat protein
VVALRLANHARFDDPELLGDYVLYRRSSRCRLPSIYRQTIVRRLASPPDDQISAGGNDDLRALWSLLLAYICGPVAPAIEHALSLFRRAHNLIGGQPSTKAQLLYATMDVVLGRPSGGESAEMLTRLARIVAPDLAGPLRWYIEHGHAVRNAVAHGYWDHTATGPRGAEALAQLMATIRVALPAMLGAWLLRADDMKPAKAFRAALDAGASDLDWRQFLSRVPSDRQEQHRKQALARRYSASDLPRMLQVASAAMNNGDVDRARLWFTRAADDGSAPAMNALGVLEKRAGNVDAARRWYTLAAAGGEVDAVFNRSILESEAGDADLARELCEEAAGKGSHKAMRTLGQLEENAAHHDAAWVWYEKAAAAGSVNAMNDLGSIAAAAGDLDRARNWWEAAASKGHAMSARNLGALAWKQGDLSSARKWLETAAAAGDEQAAAWLAQLVDQP